MALQAVSWSSLAAQTADPLPDDRVGSIECCQQLLFHIGARAVALGNALTARDGSDVLFVNPAAIARLPRDEFRVHNAPTEIETSNTFTVAFGLRDIGTLAISYRLVDYGEQDETDESGNVTGRLRTLDHMLLASFATDLSGGLSGGVSYKLFQFRQDCAGLCSQPGFSGTTHGIDMGVQYHPPLWPSLQLGVSLLHLGLPLQVINAEQASPMPTRLRVGVAYEMLHHFSADSTTTLWATVDGAGSLREGAESTLGGGVELNVDNTIFARAGYSTGKGRIGGTAVGVGLRYDRFDIGIAKSFLGGSVGESFQVTFAIGF